MHDAWHWPLSVTILNEFKFPILPAFAPVNDSLDWHTTLQIGKTYGTSLVSTQWVTVPEATKENHVAAAIAVEFSFNSTSNPGRRDLAVFSCSIDARWAQSSNVGSGLPLTDNMVVYGALKSTKEPYDHPSGLTGTTSSFLPVEGPEWRFASMDKGWLEALTPVLAGNRSSGWTTAAAMLAYAGFDNSTGIITGWPTPQHTLETTIASIIVDGMSRIGLSDNGGNMHHVMPDRYEWMRFSPEKDTNGDSYFDKMLWNETIVLPPKGFDENELTKLHWSATVSGLAYKANSVSTYLALAVLFAHAAIALCHILYMLITRRSSEAWDCIEELLVLAQLSRPSKSDRLQQTSGGIYRGQTFRTKTRIISMSAEGIAADEESVQLVFDPTSAQEASAQSIQDNKAYGRGGKSKPL